MLFTSVLVKLTVLEWIYLKILPNCFVLRWIFTAHRTTEQLKMEILLNRYKSPKTFNFNTSLNHQPGWNYEVNIRYQLILWGIFVNDKINISILIIDWFTVFHFLLACLLLFLLQVLQLYFSDVTIIVLFFFCCEVKFT